MSLVLLWIYYVLSVTVMETETYTNSQVEKWCVARIYKDITKIKGPISRNEIDVFFKICMSK